MTEINSVATFAPTSATTPPQAEFRHVETLRVRWAEVDAQGIVFNGHYLMYADTAVAGWWRALALPYPQAVLGLGIDLYVRKATLEYEAAARCDERLTVGMRCGHIGRSSMRFATRMRRGTQTLVRGELVYVCANPATMQSQPVPAALRAVIEAFEAGESMLMLRTGAPADLASAALAVCAGCSDAVAADGLPAMQVVAFNRLDQPVAAGCLRPVGHRAERTPDTWRIDSLLTLPVLRGAGHGSKVLQALLQTAREKRATAVIAEVPEAALSLFLRAGFWADSTRGVVRSDAWAGSTPMQIQP